MDGRVRAVMRVTWHTLEERGRSEIDDVFASSAEELRAGASRPPWPHRPCFCRSQPHWAKSRRNIEDGVHVLERRVEACPIAQIANRDLCRACFLTMSPCFALGASPQIFTPLFASAGATRPANLSAPPAAGIVAVPMACFLINMIPGYGRLVCSRTFESLRLIHNFSMELTSELAMNPHEDSVPFGPCEPTIFGVGTRFELLQKSRLTTGRVRIGRPVISQFSAPIEKIELSNRVRA